MLSFVSEKVKSLWDGDETSKAIEPKRFNVQDKEQWLAHFREEGYVVLQNVAQQDQIDKTISGVWDKLESLGSGIERDNVSTWKDDNWPGWLHTGFLLSHGIPHIQSIWDLRSLPSVREAFAAIWNAKPDDMVSSMDIMICWRPWWTSKDIEQPRVERLHVDQSPNAKPGFHCAQGMLVLKEVTLETGGLQIVPKTNTDEVQKELASRYRTMHDWCELRHSDPYIQEDRGRLILAKPGDFIIWDSRTIHGGFVGSGKEDKNTEFARLCQTICMLPKDKVKKKKVFKFRWEQFLQGRGTTHWPNEIARHSKNDTGGQNIKAPEYNPIRLTQEQMNLIGGKPPQNYLESLKEVSSL